MSRGRSRDAMGRLDLWLRSVKHEEEEGAEEADGKSQKQQQRQAVQDPESTSSLLSVPGKLLRVMQDIGYLTQLAAVLVGRVNVCHASD